jgi:hypothetical protein
VRQRSIRGVRLATHGGLEGKPWRLRPQSRCRAVDPGSERASNGSCHALLAGAVPAWPRLVRLRMREYHRQLLAHGSPGARSRRGCTAGLRPPSSAGLEAGIGVSGALVRADYPACRNPSTDAAFHAEGQ